MSSEQSANRRSDWLSAARIAAIYLISATLWILVSDNILNLLIPADLDGSTRARMQTLKGLLFVTFTGLMLWALVVHRLRQVRKAEAEARLIESRFRQIAENMPGVVTAKDSTGRLVFVGGQIPPGLPLREHMNKRCHEIFDKATADRIVSADNEVRQSGKPSQVVEAIPVAGGIQYYLMTRFTMTGDDGQPMLGAISIDITERQNAEARIRELARELEQAHRLKDQFLSNLSHELRTPITAIRLWTDVLRSAGSHETETIREAAEMIHRSTEAQGRLIEDLLDVTRILAGRLKIDPKPADLAEVVRATVELLAPIAEERGVWVDVALPPGPVPILADSRRIQQITWNLLTNAVKFSQARGRIEVAVSQEGEEWVLSVQDYGMGIPAELLPKLFERFRQQDNSKTRAEGGLGIGLSLVKYMVDAHGGKVSAHSAGEGKGATFIVRLPVSHVLPEQSPVETVVRPPAQVIQVDRLLSSVRVLLVEDNADSRNGLALLLRKSGATVTAVENAVEALAAIDRDAFDILLSDIGLPGRDGCDLIADVRRRPAWADRPAIAISAYAMPEDRKRATDSGFNQFVVKPIDPDQLIEMIAGTMQTVPR